MTRGKRANGTGTVYIKHGSYYGRWWTPGAGRMNRKLGPARRPGSADGLTRAAAEQRLRELMSGVQITTDARRTVAVVGEALLGQLEAKGCSKSHIETVESHLRVHLVPFFKERSIDRIGEEDVTRLLVQLRRTGRAPKTRRNVLGTLHSLFELAIRRRWAAANPCKLVDLPAVGRSADIRFLTQAGLTAVIEVGVPKDDVGTIERPLYLMAAMTGLRQGELLGLRWRDLDADASKVRVRQAYVRGEFKSPKSVRGTRGVPMAAELEQTLRRLRQASGFTGDDDLVFADPQTGRPLNRSNLRKRFQRACQQADVRVVRFHDYADLLVMPTSAMMSWRAGLVAALGSA